MKSGEYPSSRSLRFLSFPYFAGDFTTPVPPVVIRVQSAFCQRLAHEPDDFAAFARRIEERGANRALRTQVTEEVGLQARAVDEPRQRVIVAGREVTVVVRAEHADIAGDPA